MVPTFRGAGCFECNGTGYLSLVGIFGLIELNDDIRQRIIKHEDATQLTLAARRNGVRSLREDGWMKIRDGVTTVEAVMRVTQEL